MNELSKDITGILMAVVGVAILFTLVNPANHTAQVVSASSTGFANILGAAMGANSQGYSTPMGGM